MHSHQVIISLPKSEAEAFIATLQKLKRMHSVYLFEVATDKELKLLTRIEDSLQAQIKNLEYFG